MNTGTGKKATTGKTQTGVALNTNQVLLTAMDTVNTKLKTLSVIFGASFRTHGESKLSSINLHKAVNIAMLISVMGQIQTKEAEYTKAAETLKATTFPVFMWEGYTLEAWQHDISLRLQQIQQAENEALLKEAQRELSTLMTNEDKLSLVLAKIANIGG